MYCEIEYTEKDFNIKTYIKNRIKYLLFYYMYKKFKKVIYYNRYNKLDWYFYLYNLDRRGITLIPKKYTPENGYDISLYTK